MLVIPAIDMRGGKCVRLVEGDFAQETVYFDEPVEAALNWIDKGAEFIHLVDLDGAVEGKPQNLTAIKKIVSQVDVPTQLGGGIRNMETIAMYLEAGVSRVILGTAAIEKPELIAQACEQYGEKIVLGIDSRSGMVATKGWLTDSKVPALELALKMKELGVKRIVYTDISCDGTLKGPNVEATRKIAEKSGLKVIASGGVSALKDIEALMTIEASGVEAAITGKAIYTGALDLEAAIKLTKEAK